MPSKPFATALTLLTLLTQTTSTTTTPVKKPRFTLTNLLSTAPTLPAYERILSQPVFQVTTPWGSPYMLFEKYKDEEKALLEETASDDNAPDSDISKFKRGQTQKENIQDVRPVSLYFMDEHDAISLADEMKQMKHMKDSDIRITSTSLGKAVRQASNLGRGLPTGQPIDDVTGKMLSMEDGGSLRHKIVPSRRELFYAARCWGRERVGHFGEKREEDAELALQPPDVIEGNKMAVRRNRAKAKGKNKKKGEGEAEETEESRLRREYAHMEGGVGLPVFYGEGLVKKPPVLKRLFGKEKAWATSSLTPLYFSYEDLMRDWKVMRERSQNKNRIPEKPFKVEVFNLMDVVTSLDKEQWKMERRAELRRVKKGWVGKIPVVHRFVKGGLKGDGNGVRSGLERIVFVPSSLGMQAKERISAYGNRKARLRSMRAWGRNA
mmetsp:Transcript_17284/g.35203  ORF Transcript_17284/g.35203 Transcript_17284/m.35203 type:complete len:436 (+) Transcript_17284:206-1513(+)